jgi:hypothetical protein
MRWLLLVCLLTGCSKYQAMPTQMYRVKTEWHDPNGHAYEITSECTDRDVALMGLLLTQDRLREMAEDQKKANDRAAEGSLRAK